MPCNRCVFICMLLETFTGLPSSGFSTIFCGTMDLGITLHASADTDLTAHSDADWAGCPDTRRSTSGYCVYLGPSLISWSSKRQPTVSRSSAEAEYRAVANAVAECSWLRQLLQELSRPVDRATVVYCDNVSAVYLSANPVHHRRTKHIELDIHFVREQVALGHIRVLHVPTSQQFADIMTKGLPTASFEEFWSSLCVSRGAASTTGGVEYMCYVHIVYWARLLVPCIVEVYGPPLYIIYTCICMKSNTSCNHNIIHGLHPPQLKWIHRLLPRERYHHRNLHKISAGPGDLRHQRLPRLSRFYVYNLMSTMQLYSCRRVLGLQAQSFVGQ